MCCVQNPFLSQNNSYTQYVLKKKIDNLPRHCQFSHIQNTSCTKFNLRTPDIQFLNYEHLFMQYIKVTIPVLTHPPEKRLLTALIHITIQETVSLPIVWLCLAFKNIHIIHFVLYLCFFIFSKISKKYLIIMFLFINYK